MLNYLAKEVHENAKAHGWWDTPKTFGEIIALCHSELSEALEEYRTKKPNLYFNCGGCNLERCNQCTFESRIFCLNKNKAECKPEGIAVELADTIIRILDYCAYADIDIDHAIRIKHEYNKIRPYKHGGKVI